MFKYIRRKVKQLVFRAIDRPLPPPSSEEKVLLSELQTAFRSLPVLETTHLLPSEKEWTSNSNCLRELVLNQNPREFLRWHVVSNSMFISSADYISKELKHLQSHPEWNTRWRMAIKESSVGHPIPCLFYPASSGNLIHHAYHVAQFEEKTKEQVHNMDCVFEFGGGYGSMCRLFYNLGFHGRYLIFDLPQFSALQRYFLKTNNLPVKSAVEFTKSGTGIVCISDIQQLASLLSDVIETENSMFIATLSISETPISIRDSILALTSKFHSFLISYQDKFGEVNNMDFFDNWKETIKNVVWHRWPIEHISGCHYLVGSMLLNPGFDNDTGTNR